MAEILPNEDRSIIRTGLRNDQILVTLTLFSRSHWHFETQILIDKSLCAHYVLNQWLEFDQTGTEASIGWGKEIIRICDLHLIFKVTPAL